MYAIGAHQNKRFKVSTGLSIPVKYWDSQNHKLKRSHPEYDAFSLQISSTLQELINTTNYIKANDIPLTIDNLRKEYNKRNKPEDPLKINIIEDFKNWIEIKRPILAKATIRNMLNTQVVLSHFVDKNISGKLNEFTKSNFEFFINYLAKDKSLRDSTIDKHTKVLKRFLVWAYPDEDFSFIRYSWTNIDDPIYITEEEINLLINANDIGYYKKPLDLFLFCCTTGMRHSDSQRFRPEWIKNGIIEYRSKKTGGKALVPLFKTTKEILQKWSGQSPQICYTNYNQYLKELFKMLNLNRSIEVLYYQGRSLKREIKPLHKAISSHVARKTFITTCLMKGIPIQDVMKMSGHSDYRSMKPYIAITNQHLKEVAKRWDI